MTLAFCQTEVFAADWKALRLGDEQLRTLEKLLLSNPTIGPTIAGAGAVRKVRFALEGRGKSGSIRVIYAHFPINKRVYFLLAFGKDEQANLSADDKAFCRSMSTRIEADLVKARQ